MNIERVFSMLKTVVDDQQGQGLQDNQEAGALQFGGREVGGAAEIAPVLGEAVTSNDEVSWTDGERRRELGEGLSAFRGGTGA